MAGAREGIEVVRALVSYRRTVLPTVRAELARWEGVAAGIPDPVLRGHALAALREKGLNAEATAAFAVLAPRPHRRQAVRAMTALQVAVDYLDTLGEQEVEEPLANGLRLHGALVAALTPPGEPTGEDWYGLHPQSEDGGYLAALVEECRRLVASLPAAEAALPAARRAAARCGEGQSHTHAAELEGPDGSTDGRAALEAWARSLEAPPGYQWWELAAGASSSVAAHAQIAAGADPATTTAEAELIDAAYFPPIGGLTVLLDDLVDRDDDLAAGAHSYTAYPGGPEQLARRLGWIADRGRAATAPLRRRHLHRAILDGVLGFYLAAPGMRTSFARPARQRLLEAETARVSVIAAVTRLQQRRKRLGT